MTTADLIDDLKNRINPLYAWQLGTESYERRLCVESLEAQVAEITRLRAEVEALREDAAKCRAELLAIHEIASCGWSNVLQHPIAPADTLTVRDVKIMAIELLKGHQTAEPRVHG